MGFGEEKKNLSSKGFFLFPKNNMNKQKVIAAMSGGVDSSVAAAFAQKSGYEVLGVTLNLKHPDENFSKAQQCAGKSDRLAVEDVCRKLEIEHFYIDAYCDFEEKVLRPCALTYLAGRTPNPCCLCNPHIKFGKLVEFAKLHGAEKIMTGHYAKTCVIDGQTRLLRGDDPKKDQTYFLYALSREELNYLEFPVGKMCKEEVRKSAAEIGLSVANRPDSQDSCFQVEGECFGETLRRLFNYPACKGRFMYNGKKVGLHNGIHQFTIGQRKGLNVALGVPGFIKSINPQNGDIELTTDPDDLLCSRFEVDRLNFHCEITDEFTAMVQIRYRSKPVSTKVRKIADDRLEVIPDTPQRAVTCGQAAVFYDGDLLLGGGVIDVA